MSNQSVSEGLLKQQITDLEDQMVLSNAEIKMLQQQLETSQLRTDEVVRLHERNIELVRTAMMQQFDQKVSQMNNELETLRQRNELLQQDNKQLVDENTLLADQLKVQTNAAQLLYAINTEERKSPVPILKKSTSSMIQLESGKPRPNCSSDCQDEPDEQPDVALSTTKFEVNTGTQMQLSNVAEQKGSDIVVQKRRKRHSPPQELCDVTVQTETSMSGSHTNYYENYIERLHQNLYEGAFDRQRELEAELFATRLKVSQLVARAGK